jgi:hypothetical protein
MRFVPHRILRTIIGLQIAMPQERDLFVTVTERIASKDMNRPLGPFLTELRKRAELHADVDQLLTNFLMRRNEFIHHITKPEGWTLTTPEGLEVIGKQLRELHKSSKEVRTIFTALLYAWKVQDELEPTVEDMEKFIEQINSETGNIRILCDSQRQCCRICQASQEGRHKPSITQKFICDQMDEFSLVVSHSHKTIDFVS